MIFLQPIHLSVTIEHPRNRYCNTNAMVMKELIWAGQFLFIICKAAARCMLILKICKSLIMITKPQLDEIMERTHD